MNASRFLVLERTDPRRILGAPQRGSGNLFWQEPCQVQAPKKPVALQGLDVFGGGGPIGRLRGSAKGARQNLPGLTRN
jgi:hypothetical protein